MLFICTANSLDTISPPLRDRMEIIQLAGYTELEKLQIAKRYLVKKQRNANGLKETQVQISDGALRAIINDYTREAGVRNLEREIGTVFRKVARKIAELPRFKARVKPENLADYLSRPRFFNEVKKRVASVGVATGMVWTPVGGDIVFIESSAMPGTGKLVLTGQLGDVMKESAQAAVSFLRSRSAELGMAGRLLQQTRHPHPRAGRRNAQGRSVGGHHDGNGDRVDADGLKVDPNLAMTGEITLTGQVLPIGGLKEKVLGAKRAGISKILFPKRNEMDLDDIPKEVRDTITFVPVEEISEVLHHALGKRVISPVPLGEDVRASNVVPMRRRNGVAKRPARVATTAERRRRTARKR